MKVAAAVPTLIVGHGNMGTKHARVLRELGGAAAVWGVVDPSEERRRRAELDNQCRSFATLDEALRTGERPGCATVAASTPLHFALASQLLAERIPTLVEKPIASSAAEGRALVALAEKQATVFTVGHVERFNPAAVAARRIVAEKLIGETIQLCFRRVGGSPANPSTALQDVLADLAVHDYDLAGFITGGTLEIVDALGHRDSGQLDSAQILGRLSTGASMQLQVNWRTPVKIRRIELTGSAGYAEINLITQEVVLYRQNPLLTASRINPDTTSYFDTYLLSFASPDRMELGIERREPLREELAAFWRAVQGEQSPMSPDDAVTVVRLTEITRELLERHERGDQDRRDQGRDSDSG
ncbi:MAG TPA: Gfo/Idh/MocA family oxidoreductase, partial [Polyangia bacterium]